MAITAAPGLRRRASAALTIALGALLAFEAAPVALAGIAALPAAPAARAIDDARPLDPSSLSMLLSTYGTVLDLAPRAPDLVRAAVAESQLALIPEANGEDPDWSRLQTARELLEEALRRNPGAALAWLRLAEVETQLDGAGPRGLAALEQSVRLAPRNFGPLMSDRLSLALFYWDRMSFDFRAAIRDQIVLAAGAHPKQLAHAARTTGRIAGVRAVLAPDQARLAVFDSALSRLPPMEEKGS